MLSETGASVQLSGGENCGTGISCLEREMLGLALMVSVEKEINWTLCILGIVISLSCQPNETHCIC